MRYLDMHNESTILSYQERITLLHSSLPKRLASNTNEKCSKRFPQMPYGRWEVGLQSASISTNSSVNIVDITVHRHS